MTLSKKLGWPCVCREDLWEEARQLGIQVSRLEVSVIRSRGREELLAREKDRYLACITASLYRRAVDGNLVYHGLSGHLLLPGVSHRIRVGLRVPKRVRLEQAMVDLGVSSDKTLRYLEQLDEDLDNWARFVHRADPRQPDNFDFFVNTENVSISNLAASLCVLADLPDFRPTPASLKLAADQDLAARARLQLALDDRTADADLGVIAEDGVLTVTYMPRQQEVAEALPDVLEDLDGLRELDCTMAETNILLLQERHHAKQDSLRQVMELAPRWGAAVELLRWTPVEHAPSPLVQVRREGTTGGAMCPANANSAGVLEDPVEESDRDDDSLSGAIDALIAAGCSGGGHSIEGTAEQVLEVIVKEPNHSLIVIGDIFQDKGASARLRETRELVRVYQERLKCPVITTDELQDRYKFGVMDGVRVLAFSVVIIAIFSVVFLWQKQILGALAGEHSRAWKATMAIAVGLLVPLVAYSYSRVTGTLLKLIGIH